MTSSAVERFRGGANVPSRWIGRVNVTWPLGELLVQPNRLVLKVRAVGWLFGAITLEIEQDDPSLIFPLEATGTTWPGVGFRSSRHEFYYWTSSAASQELLRQFENLGFNVSSQHIRATDAWKLWMRT
jgi:hypothetical protein